MKIIEVIAEAADPLGDNKEAAEGPIKVPNQGEGANKIITGDNTKATTGNITPSTVAITITIIMAIIEVEVDVAVVVIITELAAMGEAVIEAIIITNIINITHMMMAPRWSNMAHHVHFVVVSTTPLSIALRMSMT